MKAQLLPATCIHKLAFLLFIFASPFMVTLAYAAGPPDNAGNITQAVFGQPIQPPVAPTKFPPNAVVNTAASQSTNKNFYYYRRNGSKIQFNHKDDQYVLVSPPGKAITNAMSQNILTQHGNDFYLQKDTPFTRELAFTPKSPVNREELFNRIKQTAGSGSFISPVLRADKGSTQTGVAVTRGIVFQLAVNANEKNSLSILQNRFDVTAITPLHSSEGEYQLTLGESIPDAATVFQLTRNIAQLDFIEWAEPLMLAPPMRVAFEPDDPLYPAQWHLNNTGQNGALADADIDAPEGWEISRGDNTIIAIIDDSIQTTHPDLPIWNNPGESGDGKESNGIDDDGNGYVDDYRGWDFYDHDNNPSPVFSSDNHGTAVAGVAGAQGNNNLGITGSAANTRILPIRWGYSCTDLADSIRYAGNHADIISNSWSTDGCENTLDSAIGDAVNGNILGARRENKGTPVLFAAGNDASGWRRFLLSGLPEGEHTFEWVFLNDAYDTQGYNAVWLDDIVWPDGEKTDFENTAIDTIPSGFSSAGNADWTITEDGVHARGASGKSAKSGSISSNQSTSLRITRSGQAGELSYWAWVSSEMNFDFFRFYVDGNLVHQYTPGQYGHNNAVAYPASNPDAIAVGASTDGAISGLEERIYYSEFGPELDVVAPSSNDNQRITTTDRVAGYGYTSTDYTDSFGGTSAATPLVAGIVADIIGFDPSLTASEIRQVLHETSEKIGPYAYVAGRNDYYGHGRVNLLYALQSLDNDRDLVPDSTDEDDDNDGMPDTWETANGFDKNTDADAAEDADGDGLSNQEEYQQGTNPLNPDTDGDGMNDKDEVDAGRNPNDPTDSVPHSDAMKIIPIIMDMLLDP